MKFQLLLAAMIFMVIFTLAVEENNSQYGAFRRVLGGKESGGDRGNKLGTGKGKNSGWKGSGPPKGNRTDEFPRPGNHTHHFHGKNRTEHLPHSAKNKTGDFPRGDGLPKAGGEKRGGH